MLISVAPDSMQWHMGIGFAAQCKRILDSFGLSDVEVEIKDSNFIRMVETAVPSQESTSNPVQAQQKAPANSHTFFEAPVNMARKSWFEEKVQVSKYPGVQIASEAHRISGTRGLHLQVMCPDGNSRVMALTCRHVVFQESELSGGPLYQYTPQMPQKWMIQLSDERIRKIQDTIKHWRTVTVAERAGLLETIRLDEAKAKPGPPQNELLDKREAFEEVEALSKHLENHKSRQSRRFGHVFFSAKSTAPDGWFRNYALICLNEDAYFGGKLPANTIWAPEMFIDFHRTTRYQVDHDRYIKPRYEIISPATVELTSHLTKDQISEPGECLEGAQFTGEDKDCLVVAMVGAETWRGTRFGMVNNVKSVTRHAGRWGESISLEVCVISMSRSGSFAHGSDAGACVWSLGGQAMGIVSGGVGSGQADTTYVSMLDDIFVDLEKAGIQATLL
ncbi:hypothetical protein F5X68DRAFT_236147 [Plectosphaerella plurivora]|uniref:Uncharacterized protein n=1 Tax=Plectosphaerella plurivora TaxID=936078 RepID=A0A9P9A857_9PEZI|nr:hypothetical protein F5X68DRAFT_236147 [Plectosphaerella plurivora]